jgi:hypothetical protein
MIIKYEDIDRIIKILQEAKSKLKPGQVYKFEGKKVNIINKFPEKWILMWDKLNADDLIHVNEFFWTRRGSRGWAFTRDGGCYFNKDLDLTQKGDNPYIIKGDNELYKFLKKGYEFISFEQFKQFANEYKG